MLPKCGYKKVGSTIVTKHDKEISQRSNGEGSTYSTFGESLLTTVALYAGKRMMDFPDIATGDGGGLDVQLSNPVYNEIRNFRWFVHARLLPSCTRPLSNLTDFPASRRRRGSTG